MGLAVVSRFDGSLHIDFSGIMLPCRWNSTSGSLVRKRISGCCWSITIWKKDRCLQKISKINVEQFLGILLVPDNE